MVASQNNELIAKRWAKALMDLASENEEVSKENILSDLKEVAETINSSEELTNAINNPAVSVEEKQIVICKLFQNNVIPIVYNFIFTLNLKKRLNIIGTIADEFQKELEGLKNIARVGITSAIELSGEKKNEIKDRLAEKLHKEIVIDWSVDAGIIAGLIFNINETIVDNSIRHKLENLSKSIMKG